MHRSHNGGKTLQRQRRARSRSRRGRRAAATATTSGSIRRIPTRYVLSTTAAASINTPNGPLQRSACRTGRCITCTSTTACRTGSTATARTTGRCADRQHDVGAEPGRTACCRPGQHRCGAAGGGGAVAARRRRRVGWRTRARRARSSQWQPEHRRLRVRLHDSGPDQRRRRLRALLRQQGDALGRAHRHRALDRAVDGLARLAAERGEVPLPLDGADGDRSVRSRRTVLYGCQLILKTDERRPVVDRSSAPICRRRIRRASSRTAVSSATTSASTTARSSGASSTRRSSTG